MKFILFTITLLVLVTQLRSECIEWDETYKLFTRDESKIP